MPPNLTMLLAIALAWLGTSVGLFIGGDVYRGRQDKVAYDGAIAKSNLEAFQTGQARQRDADKIALDIAEQYPLIQEKLVKQTVTLTKEIPIYVKDTSSCVTIGLVRVFDAAAQGVDPATLDLDPGELNDTCAPITATTLASSVAVNYGLARQNAAQLGALQQYVRQLAESFNSGRLATPGH